MDAGRMQGMQYGEIRELLREHFQQLLDGRRASIHAKGRLSTSDKQALLNSVDIARDAVEAGWPLSIVDNDDKLLAQFMARYNVSFEMGSEQYGWLSQEMKRSYRDYAQAVRRHG